MPNLEENYLKCFKKHRYRTHFSITAKTKEEANEKPLQFYKDDKFDDIGWMPNNDVIPEKLPVEENGGMSTEELYTDNGELIYKNGEE